MEEMRKCIGMLTENPQSKKEHWNAKNIDGRALLNFLAFATTQVSDRRRNVKLRGHSVMAGIAFKWLRMQLNGAILTAQWRINFKLLIVLYYHIDLLKLQPSKYKTLNSHSPPRRYPYFDVVVELVWSHDPKSYAGGSVFYW
jgi:hypothetical protein